LIVEQAVNQTVIKREKEEIKPSEPKIMSRPISVQPTPEKRPTNPVYHSRPSQSNTPSERSYGKTNPPPTIRPQLQIAKPKSLVEEPKKTEPISSRPRPNDWANEDDEGEIDYGELSAQLLKDSEKKNNEAETSVGTETKKKPEEKKAPDVQIKLKIKGSDEKDRESKEVAARQAKEKSSKQSEREKAEREEKERIAKEKAEREEKDRLAKEKTEREEKERSAKEKADRDLKDRQEKEKYERDQ